IAYERVPLVSRTGVEIRVYSGALEGATSPVINHPPLILAVIHLEPHSRTTLHLPASYSAFLYILEGKVNVGDNQTALGQHQVGWLDRFTDEGESELGLGTAESDARLVLYAGQPQHDEIIHHGPFIADRKEDIQRLFREYRSGQLLHIAKIEKESVFSY